MEFIKNELINEVLKKYYETFALTLDTGEYVPAKFNNKIYKFIFKNLKNKFKEIDKEYKKLKIKQLKQILIETAKVEEQLQPCKSSTSEACPPC